MKSALWCASAVVSGWWAVVCAQHDVRRQRQIGHTFGEAHVSDRSFITWLVSVLCGVAVFLFAQRHESSWMVIAFMACSATGFRVSLIDIDTHTIPRRVMLSASVFLIVLLCIASTLTTGIDMVKVFVGGIGSWMFMRFLELVSRGDVGHADVVFAGYLGLFIGAVGYEQVPVAFLVSFLVAGLVALVMIATRNATRSTHLPFGPFLFVGMVVAVLR